MPEVTAFFTGIMLLMQFAFGVTVSANRGKLGIGIGDGGNEALLRLIRIHGNFSEYVPMILIAMAIAELIGSSAGLMWTGGALLVLSRVSHFVSMKRIGGLATVFLGAGVNYLLLALWGLYLLGHSAGIVPVL